MISGEYNHNIDPKSRMFLPAKLRSELGETVILAKSVDKCIAIYSVEAWKTFTEKLDALPNIEARNIKRFIYAFATETQIDSQGRVLIPQKLKGYAGIEKNVVVIGVGDHAEIWDEDTWNGEVNSENAEEIANMMIKLGF